MIQKKNRSWRMCVDCSKLNEVEWLSSLKLDMAYHQIHLAEGDKGETAFATPKGGLFQYITKPFSLCNEAGAFQRIIEKAPTYL